MGGLSSILGRHRVREPSRGTGRSYVRDALLGFDELWAELFPAEQARIVELLVDRIDLHPDRLDITLRVEGLSSLCAELGAVPTLQQAAE